MADLIKAWLGLDPAIFMALCGIVLGSGAVRGLTGFGFAILAVPLMGLVIPPTEAVLLAIILQMLIGPFVSAGPLGILTGGLFRALPLAQRSARLWGCWFCRQPRRTPPAL